MAATRHGVLSLAELTDAGLSPRAVQRFAATGWLHRIYPGVYAIGHPGLTADGRRRAAVLACGPFAALSHRSAGAAYEICGDDPARLHVLVPHGRRTAPRTIRVHQTRDRAPQDTRVLRAIPVTAVPRTLVDLAGALDRPELKRALHEAVVRRLVTLPEILAAADRMPGRRGLGTLRELARHADHGVTRSELESRFAHLCREAAIPAPRRNVRVRSFEVDALWERERVIVELDGARYHGTRRAFELDRRRDAALAAAGYVVLRLTWRRLSEEPARCMAELRAVLAQRGGGGWRR